MTPADEATFITLGPRGDSQKNETAIGRGGGGREKEDENTMTIIRYASILMSQDLRDFLTGQAPEQMDAWNRMGLAIISGRAYLPRAAAGALHAWAEARGIAFPQVTTCTQLPQYTEARSIFGLCRGDQRAVSLEAWLR